MPARGHIAGTLNTVKVYLLGSLFTGKLAPTAYFPTAYYDSQPYLLA
jgi:hypothetical protein